MTAWSTGNVYPELTKALTDINQAPGTLGDASIEIIERFTVLLYDRTSSIATVNEARRDLFCRNSRQIANIPPTKEALTQHVKRAVFQASYIWGQMLVAQPDVPWLSN